MDNSVAVFNQVLILFLIMFVGFIAKKTGIINDAVSKKLSELLLKITNPLLVLSAFQMDFSPDIMNNVLLVFIFAVVANLVSILLGQVLFVRQKNEIKKIMKFTAVYSNCGFMGFPVLESLFGRTGILYGSIYVAVFNIFLWTNGMAIFSSSEKLNRDSIKKIVLNPGIITVLIGIVLFMLSIRLPGPVAEAVDLVGSMTIPLSMLIVGATVAGSRFKELFRGWDIYYITAVRLVLMPLIAFAALKILGFPEMLMTICVLLIAMPAAATTTIFAELYDSDSVFASRVVVFTTLASIVTLPLMMLLIQL
ncbi:MAG: AEC family transporter [Acetivibrionales bacterium]|jgi:predicted permease|nr:AEC family transporter [Clostridiaceae bacterium]HPZ04754.1 AEC family transporter [Clostridiales bacterium]HQD30516.1 AEC family transporter [Clostridiales bacterium]